MQYFWQMGGAERIYFVACAGIDFANINETFAMAITATNALKP